MGLKQPPIREKGAKSSKKNLKNQVKLMMMSVVRCEMLLVPPRCVKDEPRNTLTHTHTHTDTRSINIISAQTTDQFEFKAPQLD